MMAVPRGTEDMSKHEWTSGLGLFNVVRLGRQRSGPAFRSLRGLLGAFLEVSRLVDHLKVGRSPKGQQIRPRKRAMVRPDSKQGQAVIDFGCPEQAPPGSRTASVLSQLQDPEMVVGLGP